MKTYQLNLTWTDTENGSKLNQSFFGITMDIQDNGEGWYNSMGYDRHGNEKEEWSTGGSNLDCAKRAVQDVIEEELEKFMYPL